MLSGGTMWLLLTTLGWLGIRFIDAWNGDTTKAVMIRLSALSFMAAGTIGAHGLVGDVSEQAMSSAQTAGDQASGAAVGGVLSFVLFIVLSIAWILTVLPVLFNRDPPDWLSISGLFIPWLGAHVPAGLGGEGLRVLFDSIGGWFAGGVAALIGRM